MEDPISFFATLASLPQEVRPLKLLADPGTDGPAIRMVRHCKLVALISRARTLLQVQDDLLKRAGKSLMDQSPDLVRLLPLITCMP